MVLTMSRIVFDVNDPDNGYSVEFVFKFKFEMRETSSVIFFKTPFRVYQVFFQNYQQQRAKSFSDDRFIKLHTLFRTLSPLMGNDYVNTLLYFR